MNHSVHTTRGLTGAFGLLLLMAGLAPAGPIVQTPFYDLTLPSGGSYRVSATVERVGYDYHYTYTVQNRNVILPEPRSFELGIAEHPLHILAHKHGEVSPQVTPGPGVLLRDRSPHVSATSGTHNYVWSLRRKGRRIGIPIFNRQTQQMSFVDIHAPLWSDWSLLEPGSTISLMANTDYRLGQLPVPGFRTAPEPSTLALASVALAGLGLASLRRRRVEPVPNG